MKNRMIDEFEKEVEKELGSEITGMILYGSAARGELKPDSDIDILLISGNKKIKDRVFEIASRFLIDYGQVFSISIRTPEDIRRLVSMGSPFIKSILNEGRVLYGSI